MAMGIPGWPLLAFSTASMAKNRMAFTERRVRSLVSVMLPPGYAPVKEGTSGAREPYYKPGLM